MYPTTTEIWISPSKAIFYIKRAIQIYLIFYNFNINKEYREKGDYLIINLDQETIYEFARLSFIANSRKTSYLNTFNNYYLQEYMKAYKDISTFKFQLFKKLGITEYNNYEIDVANLRIIFKEENNND